MIYFTFGEGYSGVYKGQVIDVCQYLSQHLSQQNSEKIRLVSFVSIRGFLSTRKKIKQGYGDSIVIPMLPKASTWKLNLPILFILAVFLNEKIFICRNIKATNLALYLKKAGWLEKVCLDGRGAFAAESEEYLSKNPEKFEYNSYLERNAVINSDFRIAVSSALVKYWKREYDYSENDHVIIPCTVNDNWTTIGLSKEWKKRKRADLGFKENDVLMVYSGSTAGWQSFNLIEKIVTKLFLVNEHMGLVLLTKRNNEIENLIEKYSSKVIQRWVKPDEVKTYLSICDYGLLIREESVTNSVAAPTKFAEYLSTGLSVIISENVGDYTDFVRENNCGFVIDDSCQLKLDRISSEKSMINKDLAEKHFTKQSTLITNKYDFLLNHLV